MYYMIMSTSAASLRHDAPKEAPVLLLAQSTLTTEFRLQAISESVLEYQTA